MAWNPKLSIRALYCSISCWRGAGSLWPKKKRIKQYKVWRGVLTKNLKLSFAQFSPYVAQLPFPSKKSMTRCFHEKSQTQFRAIFWLRCSTSVSVKFFLGAFLHWFHENFQTQSRARFKKKYDILVKNDRQGQIRSQKVHFINVMVFKKMVQKLPSRLTSIMAQRLSNL